MEKRHIGFELSVYRSEKELSKEDAALLSEAERARESSYSPYSKFSVGTALLLQNGEVVLGSNQENASFPAGLCAERVALFYAGANYPNERIMAIAITASSVEHALQEPAGPCGMCRQAISEYEYKQGNPIRIIMKGKSGPVYICDSIRDLLPLGFDSSFL